MLNDTRMKLGDVANELVDLMTAFEDKDTKRTSELQMLRCVTKMDSQFVDPNFIF